ncbi:glutathione S-transferase [Sandaracinobacter neustonicus]|uniref:Glutathione S-transferase n=1 Tax=Sandaracinobacter neustonicus TaxID=1715348 RepID=A0A501XQF1_9SPHN|nr:glutathione S-transferase [Sandaracinobacter neustonicus]TPE62639.1 glutathione S-transferase [Sandaracinobacter neustonicus]
MKLIITNRRYSSWSLRGWLAAKQSGLPFDEEYVDIYAPDWAGLRATGAFAEANGKVPILIDGDSVIWNALGIIDWLDRKSGGTRFWPQTGRPRAFAVSAAVEMQAGFNALRQHCPMNCMRHYPGWAIDTQALPDIARVDQLWSIGLSRFGGPWLAGEQWSGADILFAPVASRLTTYDAPLSPEADAYRQRVMAHPHVAEWVAEAAKETVLREAYEH